MRPISPPGVLTDALRTSDGRYVVGGRRQALAVTPRCVDPGPRPFLPPTDLPRQWSADGCTSTFVAAKSGRRQSIAWT